MIKLPIEKLQYSNPPSYKTVKSYRPYLREVSKYTCSYCGISEAECSGATFNIDHFRPQMLFPDFSTTCSNLRYSCPRCNSYKSDNWITKEQGCIRNCAQCSNKVCTQDIARFIDTLNEDPSTIFYVSDDDKIYAYSSSNVASYTINYLRLNRIQLIRLRHIRRFMEKWEQELKEKLSIIDNDIKELHAQYSDFISLSNVADSQYYKIINTMFQLLEKQQMQSKIFIEQELSKLTILKSNMSGKDDRSLPME